MNDEALSRKLGYVFSQPRLLQQALTHRSHSSPHNERLEFLGDSVLNCVIAIALFEQFPGLAEGDLSRLRASFVNKNTLFDVAQRLEMGTMVRLGEGELKSGGSRRPSILADALEAVLGAIFVDGGFSSAERVIRALFSDAIARLDPQHIGKDPKTLLQEALQGRKIALPTYTVVSVSGEAHRQTFKVECSVPALELSAIGEGSSRREAEQNAAAQIFPLIA